MKTRFFADYDLKELKTRLDAIIDHESEDNLKTHFRQIILFADDGKVSGKIENDNFKIWTHEQFGFASVGIFYPIIEGRTKLLSKGIEIEFHSKMNLIGRTAFLFFAIALAIGIFEGIVLQENNELRYLIPRFIAGTVLFGLMISLPTILYLRTSKITKEYLLKNLGLRNER